MREEEFPLVSVLIPCYTHAHYVVETLDSIVADDYPVKELVIINDGSRDNSDQVIRNWILSHDHLINIRYHARENLGICKTLNELVQMAKGAYLVFIASDDVLIPGSIKPRVEFLMQQRGKMVVVADAE